MHFFATINPTSGIHRDWRHHNRVSGLVSEVLFRYDLQRRAYVSGELPPEAVTLFQTRSDKAILLETLRVLPEPEEHQFIAEAVKDPEPQQVDGEPVRRRKTTAKPQKSSRRRLVE